MKCIIQCSLVLVIHKVGQTSGVFFSELFSMLLVSEVSRKRFYPKELIAEFPTDAILTSDFLLGHYLVYAFSTTESWRCAFLFVLMCSKQFYRGWGKKRSPHEEKKEIPCGHVFLRFVLLVFFN